jgi:hypothetical protein
MPRHQPISVDHDRRNEVNEEMKLLHAESLGSCRFGVLLVLEGKHYSNHKR